MNDKIKRFAFYNIFFLCAFIGLFMVLGLKSFADVRYYFQRNSSAPYTSFNILDFGEHKICLYKHNNTQLDICSLESSITVIDNYTNDNGNTTRTERNLSYESAQNGVYIFRQLSGIINYISFNNVETNIPIFENLSDCYNFLAGYSGEGVFDETLKLDSFKIISWQIKASQLTFHSKLDVRWSDERIANVQVRVVGTANSPTTFEGNQSPFKQKFYASNYVMKNGDVIHFTATPYKSNGEFGESLYYSLIYDDGLPTNWYRKIVNTPYNDNTLDIPYYDVSAQPQTINVPIDGTTENVCYKINYNPTTNEITNETVYNVYYSPVVVLPENTLEETENEVINYITNEYNTNNYYNIVNNISYNDVSYGDVSEGEIKETYKETKDYFKLFRKFVKLLANIVGFIFPFLSGGVVLAITVGVGFITVLIIAMFAVKLIGKILDWLF